MGYTITYYSEAVQESILTLPETLRARYFNLTDRMVFAGRTLEIHIQKPSVKVSLSFA